MQRRHTLHACSAVQLASPKIVDSCQIKGGLCDGCVGRSDAKEQTSMHRHACHHSQTYTACALGSAGCVPGYRCILPMKMWFR